MKAVHVGAAASKVREERLNTAKRVGQVAAQFRSHSHIEELLASRFLFGRIDISGLRHSPEDTGWIDELPLGLVRDVAGVLQAMSNPAAQEQAGGMEYPERAEPAVASRALLELYALAQREKPWFLGQ